MLEPITIDDFHAVQKIDAKYYCDSRFDYYAMALRVARVVAPNADRVLELGPYLLPIFRNAETLDLRQRVSPTYHRDGGDVPWPITDGAYDLFVGLQSFEHLGSIVASDNLVGEYGERQPRVFREVRRIARAAVISLPWQWNAPTDRRHHNIDESTLGNWFDRFPCVRVIVGRRILLGFQFD